MLTGGVSLLTLLLCGNTLASDLETNLLAVPLSQCVTASNNNTACQIATQRLAASPQLSEVNVRSSMIRRAYAALGYYSEAVQEWSTDRSTNNSVDAYWLGLAYERLGQFEATVALWQAAGLPSQVPLRFVATAHAASDQAQLQRWVMLAQQLTPVRNSELRPYPDIDEYAVDLNDWGYPLLAADLQQLIADHEPDNKIHHWYALAEAARLRDDWLTAIRILTTARMTWPNDELLRVRLIQAYLGGDDPHAAQQIAADWLLAQPANSVALFWGAEAAFQAKDFANVRQWCERLITLGVNNNQRDQCHQWLKVIP